MGSVAGAGGARPRHGRPGLPHAPDARGLISGDALWRNGFGILFAEVIGEGGGLEAARATLEALARLSVDWVIPGHGAPFVEVDEAFEAAFARLRYLEEDGARIARSAIRACVTFWLLERRRVALDDLPAHLASVAPLPGGQPALPWSGLTEALAGWLADELRSGRVRREGGFS